MGSVLLVGSLQAKSRFSQTASHHSNSKLPQSRSWKKYQEFWAKFPSSKTQIFYLEPWGFMILLRSLYPRVYQWNISTKPRRKHTSAKDKDSRFELNDRNKAGLEQREKLQQHKQHTSGHSTNWTIEIELFSRKLAILLSSFFLLLKKRQSWKQPILILMDSDHLSSVL